MEERPTSRFTTPQQLRVSDDTRIHVAQLLQEPIGASRQARLAVADLPLDGEMTARRVAADLKLTRIPTGVLVDGEVAALVNATCIRCLEGYDHQARTTFADEYRPTVDVLTGTELSPEEGNEHEAEYFTIPGNHILDVKESLRQAIILGLPMAPLCREDCPGIPEAAEAAGDPGDSRFAVLGSLLKDSAEGDDTVGRRNAS